MIAEKKAVIIFKIFILKSTEIAHYKKNKAVGHSFIDRVEVMVRLYVSQIQIE